MSRTDMEARGWDELDFIFVSGDAYVDHPGFGTAIICRVLEAHGYSLGLPFLYRAAISILFSHASRRRRNCVVRMPIRPADA